MNKILIIKAIPKETTNESTIHTTLYGNVILFYRQELATLFQMQEELKAWRNSKLNFSSSCLIADKSHAKIIWLHQVVFIEHETAFLDNKHLLK